MAGDFYYTIHRSITRATVNDPDLRSLFDPFYKEALSVFSAANCSSVCNGIIKLGKYATTAIETERFLHLGSVTTNHLTRSGQRAPTFSMTEFHYLH